jgi:hypothetical protein
MAEYVAPFIINRTIGNLTFYQMEGRNLVRKKSSLTRRKVLYSPRFERTRHYAGLMAKASRIGSALYQALPSYWRQFWMYRSFTGEALTMLKTGKTEQYIQQQLWERYVKEVAGKQTPAAAIPVVSTPKRAYQKRDTDYWTNKTIKASQRKIHKQRILHNAHLLSRASKLASTIYNRLPPPGRKRCYYYHLVALAMELLRQDLVEADIMEELGPLPDEHPPTQAAPARCQLHEPGKKNTPGLIQHPEGYRYFISALYKRFTAASNQVLAGQPVLLAV